ncbi:hypothetical protein BGS_0591 [Beggiatoa sp. SS]|nr:hypothetical protein BGS_0591 [Beggiatoa sp. SS]
MSLDAESVNTTVNNTEREWGAIPAILHVAGANKPSLVRDEEEPLFRRTVAKKEGGGGLCTR